MMEGSFAGFWRDGAVVKPESRHGNSSSCVVAKLKKDGGFYCMPTSNQFWSGYYWLDTTTPTELTPQEAFELLKTITPTLERIEKQGNLYSAYADERISIINWGSITEYPPRERWRVPTDADKGKRCRFKDGDRAWNDYDDSYLGTFLCTTDDAFVVGIQNGISRWRFCEVLE
jgi:hypothetical protein